MTNERKGSQHSMHTQVISAHLALDHHAPTRTLIEMLENVVEVGRAICLRAEAAASPCSRWHGRRAAAKVVSTGCC